mgnify:CR=1 FL=1
MLRDYMEALLKEKLSGIRITGKEDRSPHISHIVVPDFDSELLVLELDARGFAVSAKSACKNDLPEQPVSGDSTMLDLLYPHQRVGAIRVSFGRMTTKKELTRFVNALLQVIEKYRS